MIIDGNECESNKTGYWVYYGMGKAGKVDYVGTTSKRPSDKFYWHKNNGKDLKFIAIKNFSTAEEMKAYEGVCIVRLKPCLNERPYKAVDKRELSAKYVAIRTGSDKWCQECLRKRVSHGYRKCVWCML